MNRLSINRLMLLSLGVLFILIFQAPAVSAEQSLGTDESEASVNFSNILSLNGTVFNDLNGNGFMDEGEPGLPGWTIRLMQDEMEVLNVTSDQLGEYIFEGLDAGEYVVAQDLMPGWNQTAPGGGSYNVTLVDKDGKRYDFGNFEGAVLATSIREYPLMRPSPETLQRWIEVFKMQPLAEIDPEISAELDISPTGSLSLLNHLQYIPAERDQWDCGNCWVWAGTGVMEIGLSVEEGIKDRLSIQYLNSNYLGGSGSDWACCGNWLVDLANFYAGTGKAIPWSNANGHWQDGGRTCEMGSTSVPAGVITTTPNYPIDTIEAQAILTHGVGSATAISNIKNVLNQNKAVTFSFFLPTLDEWNIFGQFWLNQPESALYNPTFPDGKAWNDEQGAGHDVLCVGYNDNDPNNKYWIMLNSWGTTAGRPNGLFRVNMNMNYDNYFTLGGQGYYAFYWETLDLEYDLPEYGKDTVGVFDPTNGLWFLDYDNNGVADKAFYYGAPTHKPVTGDWNGDGKDTVGVFDPATSLWFLDNNNDGIADQYVYFGASTHIPVTGDWNGDGRDTVGVFDPTYGIWFLDYDNNGVADKALYYGAPTHKPVTGDWNGDGKDTVGVFDPTYGIWFLDYDNNGVADKAFYYGAPTHKPVTGDWNQNGKDTVGVFDPATSLWFLDYDNNGAADEYVYYGASSHVPVTGNWLQV